MVARCSASCRSRRARARRVEAGLGQVALDLDDRDLIERSGACSWPGRRPRCRWRWILLSIMSSVALPPPSPPIASTAASSAISSAARLRKRLGARIASLVARLLVNLRRSAPPRRRCPSARSSPSLLAVLARRRPESRAAESVKRSLKFLLALRQPVAALVKHMLNESARLDLAFQALADPTRRGMLARLSRGPASVSELARPLTISLPAVLQHLQTLEASGLVRSEKKGRVRTCRIEPKALGARRELDRRAARALGGPARPARRLSRRHASQGE